MPHRFEHWENPKIEDGIPTKFNWIVKGKEHFSLGYRTDIGAFSYINAKHGVIIEDYVQIGSHCSIYSVSTIDNKHGPVYLKKNCRIGTHSAIMPNVTVGENSIIGAFSYVDKDIPSGVIAMGIPARKIRPLSPERLKIIEKEVEP